MWFTESQVFDAVFSPDGRHVATFGGHVYRTSDGSLAGMAKMLATARFTPDGKYLLKLDRTVTLHDVGGKLLRNFGDTGISVGPGEQAQWAYLTANGRYAVVLARDLPNPPQKGIVIFERQAVPGVVPPIVVQ